MIAQKFILIKYFWREIYVGRTFIKHLYNTFFYKIHCLKKWINACYDSIEKFCSTDIIFYLHLLFCTVCFNTHAFLMQLGIRILSKSPCNMRTSLFVLESVLMTVISFVTYHMTSICNRRRAKAITYFRCILHSLRSVG